MILSDREIEAALHYGHIRIEPRPAPELWTSTAIDLTLDHVLLRAGGNRDRSRRSRSPARGRFGRPAMASASRP